MQIALIGNGPVSFIDGLKVDAFDYVVRLNSAKNYKLAGRKTDLLFMASAWHIMQDRALDWRAFDSAKMICSLASKDIVYGRRIQALPISRQALDDGLGSIGWSRKAKTPSMGIRAIAALLVMFPQATIHLFGFTHRVSPSHHDGDEERNIAEELIAKGVLVRHAQNDRFPFNLVQAIRKGLSSIERRVLTWLRHRQLRRFSAGTTS